MPTALDDGQRPPRKLLGAVVRRVLATLGSLVIDGQTEAA